MLRTRNTTLLLFPLITHFLAAQVSEIDQIEPVPAPEFPSGKASSEFVLPEKLKINNASGTIEGDPENGIRFGGPVKVEGDNGIEVFSDRAQLDLKQKSVTFEGNVSVYQGNMMQRGERTVYFYESGKLDTSSLRVSMDAILLESGKFTGVKQGEDMVFVGENAGVTGHDIEKPAYWLRADKTIVYPGDRVHFHNLKLYAGDIPVFWLPYLSQPLSGELGYRFIPGARSNWGPFLLNTYGIMLGGERNELTGEKENQWLLSRWHFDLRARRGVGLGVDLMDTRQPDSEDLARLSLYYMHDFRPNDTRTGIPRFPLDNQRFQLEFIRRKELDFSSDADWRIDSRLSHLSDQHFLEDLAPQIYRTNPAPDNTIGLYRRDDASLLSVFGRFRVNDFYRTDTQSPEIAFDQARRSLFQSPLLHEGETSFSIRGVQASDVARTNLIEPLLALPLGAPTAPRMLEQLNGRERTLVQRLRNLAPGDPQDRFIRAQLLDTGFQRLHSNHSFSMPLSYGDWFSFTPRAGAAYTHYSAVLGPSDSDARSILHGGIESAVKVSKNFSDFRNSQLGIDGLLHVVQPYLNWSALSADELGNDYPSIDHLTFNTRPNPLNPSQFTAIDDLQTWNILRFGTRHNLITHRDAQSHDWLFMDTYIDKYLNHFERDVQWSNLYNDLRWQPIPWLSFDLETQTPIIDSGSGFSEITSGVNFMPDADKQISLQYRQLSNHPVLVDSDRIALNTYLRLAENWGVGSNHIFEMDDGVMEVQQFSLHRDFGNWVFAVGLTKRDNRFDEELGLILSLTLKDFPSATLPFQIDTE